MLEDLWSYKRESGIFKEFLSSTCGAINVEFLKNCCKSLTKLRTWIFKDIL